MTNKNFDILLELEELEKAILSATNEELEVFKNKKTTKNNYFYQIIVEEKQIKQKKFFDFKHTFIFGLKYLATSFVIFGILLVGTNYNAYFNMAKGFLFKEEYQKQSQSILNSVQATNLKEKIEEEEEEEETLTKKETVSIKKYKAELNEKSVSFDIEITPYENRILIPKIGKNIPLIDIKNRQLENKNELENIFMEELANGVIRYPGSAIPGEEGNSFIFGHSSNFPWIKGDYNDVFSNLNYLEAGDEIITYYNQKKYVYKVTEKIVIKPGDVSILKRNENKKEISIMTCWPVGTTLNRLVVIGEMVEE